MFFPTAFNSYKILVHLHAFENLSQIKINFTCLNHNVSIAWNYNWKPSIWSSNNYTPVSWIRIRTCLDLSDPDPTLFVKVRIRIRILRTSSKKSKKPLIYTVLWLLSDFLSLKIEKYLQDVRYGSRQKKKIFLLSSWKPLTIRAGSKSGFVSHWHGSPDPDPYQYASRIHNTATLAYASVFPAWFSYKSIWQSNN